MAQPQAATGWVSDEGNGSEGNSTESIQRPKAKPPHHRVARLTASPAGRGLVRLGQAHRGPLLNVKGLPAWSCAQLKGQALDISVAGRKGALGHPFPPPPCPLTGLFFLLQAPDTVSSFPPPPASMIQVLCRSIADYVTTCFSLVPSPPPRVPSVKASGYVDASGTNPRAAQLD